jgi:hypothetical protein
VYRLLSGLRDITVETCIIDSFVVVDQKRNLTDVPNVNVCLRCAFEPNSSDLVIQPSDQQLSRTFLLSVPATVFRRLWHSVVQLIEAPLYKLEGRGLDSMHAPVAEPS